MTQIAFMLAAGALLVASGLFIILYKQGATNYLGGVILLTSGINVDGLVFSRYVAGTRTGDVISFVVIVAAASTLLLIFAWFQGRLKNTSHEDATGKRGPS